MSQETVKCKWNGIQETYSEVAKKTWLLVFRKRRLSNGYITRILDGTRSKKESSGKMLNANYL